MQVSKSGQITIHRTGGNFKAAKQIVGWAALEKRQDNRTKRARRAKLRDRDRGKSPKMGPDAPGQTWLLFDLDVQGAAVARCGRRPTKRDYTRQGKTQRRGFWVVDQCANCGGPFERRSRPWRDKRPRRTCSPQCSDAYARTCARLWAKAHPEKQREYRRRAYAKQDPVVRRAKARDRDRRRRQDPEFMARKRATARRSYYKDVEKTRATKRAYYTRHKDDPEFRRKQNASTRRWHKAHPDYNAQYARNYKAAHPEVVAAAQAKYRAAHRDEINAHQRRYQREKRKDPAWLAKRRAYNRDYAEKNKARLKANGKKYRAENRDEVNARQRARYHAQPDAHRAYARKYYLAHRDKILGKARAKAKTPEGRAALARYRETHRQKRAAK